MIRTKKKKDGNRSFQRQVLHSVYFDFRPFRLEYLELEKSIWCKLNCFEFLIQRPITLPKVSRKKAHMREMIFLRQPINSASKHILWRNKSNLLKCKLFTLKMTVFIFFRRIQTDWRDVRIRVSYKIKIKRERKRRRRVERRRKLYHFLLYPKLYSHLF